MRRSSSAENLRGRALDAADRWRCESRISPSSGACVHITLYRPAAATCPGLPRSALAHVGTPYIWGGETTGVGFDCSGLLQAAYKVAGVSLPPCVSGLFETSSLFI
jgi:hypothetical protein